MIRSSIFLLSFILTVISNAFSQEVKVTHLANQGVLIESADTKILIDAIFDQEFDYLDVLDMPSQGQLTNAIKPFDSIDYILATHIHGDHFNASLITNYLKKQSEAIFAGTRELIGLMDSLPDEIREKQLLSFTPGLYKSEVFVSSEKLKIQWLSTRHLGTAPWNEATNTPFLVTIGTKKVLHWGDGEINPNEISAVRLSQENLDVVILPVWAISSPEIIQVIQTQIGARITILSHFPLGATDDQLNQIRSLFPDAILWNRQFEHVDL